MGCHTNQAFFNLAVRLLRDTANELLDFIESSTPGATAPLAGVAVARPVTPVQVPPRGVGTGKEEQAPKKEESKTDPPAGTAGTEEKKEEEGQDAQIPKASEESKEEQEERDSPDRKARKEKKRDKEKGRSRSRGKRDKSTRLAEEKQRSQEEPIRPSCSRARREESPRREPEVPPGQWTLRASPGWRVIDTGRPLDRSQRPPEPLVPPPHWKGTQEIESRKSKGVKRRERSKDINLFGFSAERKAERLRRDRR